MAAAFDGHPQSSAPLRRPPTAGEEESSRPAAFLPRSSSSTPRTARPSSPEPSAFGSASLLPSSSFRSSTSRFSPSASASSFTPSSSFGRAHGYPLVSGFGRLERLVSCFGSLSVTRQRQWPGRKRPVASGRRRWRSTSVIFWILVLGFFFLMNWWMFSRLQGASVRRKNSERFSNSTLVSKPLSLVRVKQNNFGKGKKPYKVLVPRLLGLAAHALAEAESKPEPRDLWLEPSDPEASWIPCADQRSWEACEGSNGYILVSANGGINQQRVAICNAVAIARLLNSTLVVPRFLYNSVWKDKSQFSDLYQEEHFINYLKADVRIVKELPVELRSLDLEAIGSLVTDAEVMKEAKPSFYVEKILPILLKNRVVHFVGFGNRLAFDPVPFELQRLRCRCNFHALQFVEKIQETGALLVQRLRRRGSHSGPLEQSLLGPFTAKSYANKKKDLPSRYLAVHLRFEIDMAAYSLCYFGGGKDEEEELEAYRAVHFPALTLIKKKTKVPSASLLRSEGQCPLTPEEAVLMLAALGFKRRTSIYVAGSQIYGGKSRMAAWTSLYPNSATKESLLTSSEIGPFRNFSSQLAALDFIVCAAADAFAMTDSGSQLSSLVQGYRMYYGGGKLPTIRPNKRRLASIFSKNSTIEWKEFEKRVRKAVKQTKHIFARPIARSVYRHPRCSECMCKIE